MTNIPIEFLSECYAYDPLTGEFSWRLRPRCHYRDDRYWHRFKRKYAGRPTGSIEGEGYVVLHLVVDGRAHTIKAHRLAFALMEGRWPHQIDHINGDRADNRWTNLREVDMVANLRNRAVQKRSRTGVQGVMPVRGGASYRAYIGEAGRQVRLGTFATLEEAAEVRRKRERDLHYHPNHGRPSKA